MLLVGVRLRTTNCFSLKQKPIKIRYRSRTKKREKNKLKNSVVICAKKKTKKCPSCLKNFLPWNFLPCNFLFWNFLPWNYLPWNFLFCNFLPWNFLPWNFLFWNFLSWNFLPWKNFFQTCNANQNRYIPEKKHKLCKKTKEKKNKNKNGKPQQVSYLALSWCAPA